MMEDHLYIIEAIAMIIVMVWGYFKQSELYHTYIVGDERIKIIAAVENAVSRVYNDYVRAIKKDRADGQLTEEEKASARKMATSIIKEELRTNGVNLARTAGTEVIDALIEAAVNKMKSEPKTLNMF